MVDDRFNCYADLLEHENNEIRQVEKDIAQRLAELQETNCGIVSDLGPPSSGELDSSRICIDCN